MTYDLSRRQTLIAGAAVSFSMFVPVAEAADQKLKEDLKGEFEMTEAFEKTKEGVEQ